MIEAVIFDIDGTIVDSVDLHAKAWQRAFEKFGKKISYRQRGRRYCRCISLNKSLNNLAIEIYRGAVRRR
jgi:beta-phosphoglucomutase-like phosphatase (HAD superfamily)